MTMTTEEKQSYILRIYNLACARGLCRTRQEFSGLLEMNYSTISSAMSGNERFLTDSLVRKVQSLSRRYQLDGEEPDPQLPPTSGGVWLPAETAQLYNNMSETIRMQAEMLSIFQKSLPGMMKKNYPLDGGMNTK